MSIESPVERGSFPYLTGLAPTGGSEPVLASLPHIWLALIITLSQLDGVILPNLPGGALTSASDVLAVALLATCVIISVYAWQHEISLWMPAWSGYIPWAFAAVAGNILYLLDAGNWVYSMGLQLLALLAMGIGYWVRFRFVPLHALEAGLALLPASTVFYLKATSGPEPMDLPMALSAIVACLAAAVVAAGAAVSRQRAIALVLTAGACAITWLFHLGLSINQIGLPGGPSGTLFEIVESQFIFLVISLVFFLGPWGFWSGWDALMRRAV